MRQIDKNVPIPKPAGPKHRGGPWKYPWREMEIGDSFFVVGKTSSNVGLLSGVRKRYSKRKWTMRTLTEDSVCGVRIWRIA